MRCTWGVPRVRGGLQPPANFPPGLQVTDRPSPPSFLACQRHWGRCPANFELGIPPAAALALALAAAPQHGHLRTCALTRTHMCTALQPRTRTHTDTRTRHTRAHTNTQTQNRRTDSHTVGVGVGRCKGEGRSISEKDGVEDHGGDSGEERRRERGDRLRGSAHRSNF